jgi:predicted phosphodiesterase
MLIHYVSDLHLDGKRSRLREAELDCDMHIIAGDLCEPAVAKRLVAQFMDGVTKPVVMVLGNHDHYGANWDVYNQRVEMWRGLLSEVAPTARLLEKQTTVINDVEFVGCTYWSGLTWSERPMSQHELHAGTARSIADFRAIPGWSIPEMLEQHAQSNAFLEAALAAPRPVKKRVVVTHFVPRRELMDPKYAGSILNPYFVNDRPDLGVGVDHWFFGHTHSAVDLRIDGCNYHCNPRGYSGENTGFRVDQTVEV